MPKKYIMISLDDERSTKISHILGNKTCKKIIGVLSEKESSEKDISDELKIPINTIEYNLNKLTKTGLIEKSKNFFWSKKGRKIDMYKVSNKSIVISPKSQITSKLKTIAPVAIASIIGVFLIKLYSSMKLDVLGREFTNTKVASTSVMATEKFPELWPWFLGGVIFAMAIYLIWNWRKL